MNRFHAWIIACLATMAFLAPVKFGTPVVSQALVTPPPGFYEWFLSSWPNQLGVMVAFMAFTWLVLDQQRMAARVDALFVLPLVFLLTQVPAMLVSINRQVSNDTVMHFAVCVLLFYGAAWYVRDGASAATVFGGLALATFVACVMALDQYFGGLEETRRFAALYVDPATAPEGFLAKMTSNRVFGSFVYPNTLAGYLVLAFPPLMAWIWVRARGWDARLKCATLIITGGLMIFCLALTGSRGGFVAFTVSVMAGLWCLTRGRAGRMAMVGIVALAVLGGVFFGAQRGGLIGVGTRSLQARTDYWRGAVAIARDNLLWGTGPGTFGSIYPKYKTAQTEEAQLVHNSFLQMWSDSGVLAFLVFAVLWAVAMRDALRLARVRSGDAAAVAICAGLAGWVVHSFVDFDLHVPGVAFPAFLLLGALQGLKEVREVSMVTPRGKTKWLVGGVCAILVGAVVWTDGRAVAAGIAFERSIEWRSRDPAQALEQARRAVALSPGVSHYYAAAGDLALALGRTDEAVKDYRAAVDNDRFRAAYYWRLGRALRAVYGVNEAALKHLRFAHTLNPTNQRYGNDLAAAEQESVRHSADGLLESAPAGN
jgi:O-antigen ligase